MPSPRSHSADESSSLSDDLLECCQYESLSEGVLREIVENHGLTSDDTPITLSDYKFFHRACMNETVNEGMIQYLLEYFPGAVSATDEDDWSPLHCACDNKNVTLGMVKLLIDAHPASVRSKDNDGATPLHALCHNSDPDEDNAVQILKLLIEKYPEAVQHHDDKNGYLPIHVASVRRSPEFCRLLIDAAPDSVRRVTNNGMMPLHALCGNRMNEGTSLQILALLINAAPDSVRSVTNDGWTPLHVLCNNREVDEGNSERTAIQIMKILINAAPDSVRSVANDGWTPLHVLCGNKEVDEGTTIEMMRFLIENNPGAVQHTNNTGSLPIHTASWGGSPGFCRVLIEAYPGSERICNVDGLMPLHIACAYNSLATVKYLYRLHSSAITHATTGGMYPIHFAIHGTPNRDNPIDAVETVKFLLDCDPSVKLQKFRGRSLLHHSFRRTYDASNIEAGLQIIKVIYSARPEAIEDNRIASDIHNFHQQVQAFLNNELVYSRQAKDRRLMTTPDDNGQLPLHTAVQNNVTLGSIKLLVKGNPAAVQSPDNNGALPLHVACQYHNSTNVIQYLVELDNSTLDALDRDENTVLHYACRDAKYDAIALLLEMYDAVSVSKRNAQNKLPIELLWENSLVSDRESIEYTESVFRLLQAHPEMIMNCNTKYGAKFTVACSCQNEKKRKLDAV